jgi:hypothetical protein
MPGNRKTFEPAEGLPVMFDIDDDWQRLPSLGGMFMQHADGVSHAYVETIDSESHAGSKDNETVRDDMSVSDLLAQITKPVHKGKEKESDDLRSNPKDVFSSTASIIADSPPDKLPVHVYDIGEDASLKTPKSAVPPVLIPEVPKTPVSVAEGANIASVNNANNMDTSEAPAPTPTSPGNLSNVSITQDVAALLNDLMNVFGSHPEISEGIRNIIRNATNGAYWNAHRDAVSRAADQIRRVTEGEGSRAAEDLRRAEEEAGRRVSEALGRFFGSLSNLGTQPNTSGTCSDFWLSLSINEVAAAPTDASPTNLPRAEHEQGPLNSSTSRFPWAHPHHRRSFGGPPPGAHPFGWPPNFNRRSWGPWYPYHPPPPPAVPPPPSGSHGVPPPPPPPHVRPQMTPGIPPPPPPPPPFLPPIVPSVPSLDEPRVQMLPPLPPPPLNMGYTNPWAFGNFGNLPEEQPTSMDENSPQRLRDAVNVAKQRYKDEKERYRREREERQKARERRAAGLGYGR